LSAAEKLPRSAEVRKQFDRRGTNARPPLRRAYRLFHDLDLVVRQAVEFVHNLIDLPIRRRNLALQDCRR